MFYTNTPNGFSDLNYFYAPFCIEHPLQETKFHNVLRNSEIYVPRPVKVIVISKAEDFIISSPSSFQIPGREEIRKDPHQIQSALHSNAKFCVSKLTISDKIVAEFNNYPKLKKINSAYHLKRKVSTKLQKDIKNSLNDLIQQINSTNDYKLPYAATFSKEFRENVKNESLKEYGDLTIGKYICEDVHSERSIGKIKHNANISLAEAVEKMNESCESALMKALNTLLNKTLVKDYYENFLNSSRYRKCQENDIKKYKEKLTNENLNLSEEKKELYTQIYSEKYEGIARKYFSGE